MDSLLREHLNQPAVIQPISALDYVLEVSLRGIRLLLVAQRRVAADNEGRSAARGINHRHIDALRARRDRGPESREPAADHEHIGVNRIGQFH